MDIGKKLNISFDEFLNKPKYEIESILRVTEEVDKKKNSINENIVKDLENKNNPKSS